MVILFLVIAQMSDVVGPKWIVRSEWERGKHGGSVIDFDHHFDVKFNTTSAKIFASFFLRNYDGDRDAARAAADKFRAETSLRLGMTKNQIRFAWCPDTRENWLEVQLTQRKIMKCDMYNLPLVEKYIWVADKQENTFYAQARDKETNKLIRFHRKVMPNCKKIDHINRNGIDNRRENLRDGSGKVNARNCRRSIANTSGVCGVYFDETWQRWVGAWIEEDGTPDNNVFTVAEHGEPMAFALACHARQEAEIRLGITVHTLDYMEIDD